MLLLWGAPRRATGEVAVRRVAAFIALCVVLAAIRPEGGVGAEDTPFTPDPERIIVQFLPDATLAEVGDALSDADVTPAAASALPGAAIVAPDTPDGDALADLNGHPAVAYAEPDYPVSVAITPNDSYIVNSCTVSGGPTLTPCQWAPGSIGLPSAWDTTTGSASVVVAVIDTGVQTNHPDLSGKLVAGYNTINDTTNVADDNGHGTHVAGTIAATTNNGSGVAGVCWACKVMPIKAMDAFGGGAVSDIVEGVNWAVANGADVINLSLGISLPGCPTSTTLNTAITNAWNAGVIVVAASGNNADDADTSDDCVMSPASHANAIAVGAFGPTGVRAGFSNYGPELDISAPGEYIISTVPGSTYQLFNGTSMATPHIAGVVGLMISSGITDKDAIRAQLLSTATDAGTAGFDNYYGHGRVNAALAVQSADTTPPAASITAPASGATVSGTISFTATASDAGGIHKVRFWAGSTYLGYDSTAPYAKSWNTALGNNGKFMLKIEALDMAGNSTVVTRTVTVINPDTTPPTVSISAPLDGASVNGTITITANAADTQGLQKVQFWAGTTYLGYDSSAPYTRTLNTATLPNGARTIKARAVDWGNNYTDHIITVTIDNPDSTPPTVNITSPLDGAAVSGTITITATATDNVGVQKVRVWVDATYLGYDSSAPYTRSWNTATVSNGPHTVRVQSVDLANNVSSDVTITVNVTN